MGVIIGAAFAGGFSRTMTGAQSQFTKLGGAIKDLSAQRGLVERFDLDTAGVEKARLALRAASKEVMTLKMAMRKNPDDAGTAKALANAEAKAAKLTNTLEKQRTKLRQSEQAMREAGVQVNDAARHYSRLGQTLDETRRKYARLETAMAGKQAAAKRLGDLKGQMLALSGAVYGASRLIGQAADFETAEVRLSTVVNTTDLEKSLKESRRHALNYSRQNLSSETEVLDIEYALDSAGLDATAARLGSEVVAKVAKVTKGQAEGVGEVVATVFNNLGSRLEGDAGQRLNRIGELLTKTQFKFQIRDFSQLGESMKMATPALVQYNTNLSQGLALIGQLNTSGLQGTMAGTALAATYRNLSKASQEFGFEIAKDSQGGLDFIQTLENLSEAIGGFDNMDQDTNDRLQKAFGEEGIRAVTLLGAKLGDLRAAQKDVEEGSKGLVDKSYQRFLDSTSGQLTLFGNNVRFVGLAFAGTLLPAVNAVLRPLAATAGWVGGMIERFPWLGRVVGGVAVGVGAFAGGLALVTAATWAWNAALLANPVGLVVGAVIGAVALIITAWEPITAFFEAVWDGIKNVFREGIGVVVKLWESTPMGMGIKALSGVAGFVGHALAGGKRVAGTAALGAALATTSAGGNIPAASLDMPPIERHVSGSPSITSHVNAPITIHAAPGMNEKELAEQVRQQLDEREQAALAAKRGSLYDHE